MPLLRPAVDCAQRAAPGEVMVPWNEPKVADVTMLCRRSTVKLPWAPVNRPVPPVMVLISVTLRRSGISDSSADETTVVSMWSPLAAIQRADPVAVRFARFTVRTWVNENSPRWVPVPVASVSSNSVAEGPCEAVSCPLNAPLKGTCRAAVGTATVAISIIAAIDR